MASTFDYHRHIINQRHRANAALLAVLGKPLMPKSPILKVANDFWGRLIKYFHENPNELKTIDRRKFEELVAELFSGFGYEVELTARTRDGGKDIIAIGSTAQISTKYLIECKRPDIGNPVGVGIVRELMGVKADEKATKAILATTTYCTKDAKLFAERNKWELELKEYDGVMTWINEYRQLKSEKA